jgi:predicted MFS family arabinose efflux permease
MDAQSDAATTSAPRSDGPEANKSAIVLLGAIAGVSAANIYYNQPLLGLMDRSFSADVGEAARAIPAATLIGFAAGIVTLIPLGDRFVRRKLIAIQLTVLAIALVAAAIAPSLSLLAVASFFVGVLSTAAQQTVPFAADLADDRDRGRIVGLVMTGLLLGILLARTISGFVGDLFGWRAVFAMAAGICLLLALVAWNALPYRPAAERLNYAALLASVAHLVVKQPVLRQAAISQGFLFGCFNLFWVTLVLLLEGAPFNLNPSQIGLFGVLGAAGVLAAPIAGRLADRIDTRRVRLAGIILTALSFAGFVFSGQSVLGLIVGTLVLDFGLNLAHIANQTRIYRIDPAARGRINTVYMSTLFIGGAIGSTVGTQSWALGGWGAVCVAGLGLAGGAWAVVTFTNRAHSK